MVMATAMLAMGSAAAFSCSSSVSSPHRVLRTMEQMRIRGFSPVQFLLLTTTGAAVPKKSWEILGMAKDDDFLAKRAKDMQTMEDFMPNFDELDKDELQSFLELELESSMDFETNKHYEIMFLIHEKNVDELEAVLLKVQDFIKENKGLVYRLNNWGMRNLAYKIKKASRANYILMNIEINSQAINDLNTLFEKDERVIRHMVMSQKAAISEDSVPPEEYRPSKEAEEEEEEEEREDEEEDDEEGELILERQSSV